MVLVKLMHVHNMNICNESPSASQAFLTEFLCDSQLASHYLPVKDLDEVAAVDCRAITVKCIFVRERNFHKLVDGFLIPVS
jgi:hypothetical protein